MSLSRENFVKIDPWDPRRQLVQGEEFFCATNSNIVNLQLVRKDAPAVERLEEALEKFYEWYPCLSLQGEQHADGHWYFGQGRIKPTTFVQDVKNNEVIRSRAQLQELLCKTFDDYFVDHRYTYSPTMYKVDIPASESEPFIGAQTGYALVIPALHLVADGKSHKNIRNFINSYLKDSSYKPRIPRPQTLLNNSSALIPEDAEPKVIKPIQEIGIPDGIDYEKKSRIDPTKRGVNIEMRRIPTSKIRRPKGYSFSVSLISYHGLLYTNLLLDYNKQKESVSSNMFCPYTLSRNDFRKIMEGHYEDISGNDINVVLTRLDMGREQSPSLREILEITKVTHDYQRKNLTQATINQRFSPLMPKNVKLGKESLTTLVTNIGDIKMAPGPIYGTTGLTIREHLIGSVSLTLTGQSDGSLIMNVLSQRTSYCNRFLKLYGDLIIRIGEIAEKRDLTRDELIAMPEYKELLELIAA